MKEFVGNDDFSDFLAREPTAFVRRDCRVSQPLNGGVIQSDLPGLARAFGQKNNATVGDLPRSMFNTNA